MEIKEYLKKFAEQLSITIEECEKDYNNFLNEFDDVENPDSQKRALHKLTLYYKRQLRSPAIGFEGIVIGVGDTIDTVARQKREAQELYRTDPQLAVTQGVTDEQGIPLDTRKEWSTGTPNPRFGKALPENNFMKNIWILAKKSGSEDDLKFYNMVLSGKLTEQEDIPIFKPVRFMAIDKEDRINPSSFTKFQIDETINCPEIKQLLDNYLKVLKIKELESYHLINKEDLGRLCCVEGDVSMLNLEPTAFGSRVMVLEDLEASLEDLEAKSLTCWTPERINLDFAEGSKVIVVGRTAQGYQKDDQGNKTEELGDISLNVFGVYAIPEHKIELPEEIKPITEDHLEIE